MIHVSTSLFGQSPLTTGRCVSCRMAKKVRRDNDKRNQLRICQRLNRGAMGHSYSARLEAICQHKANDYCGGF